MLLVVSAVSFALLSSAGGDALSALRENPQVSDETIERLRQVYGLEKSMPIRYWAWLSAFASGDMGESISLRTSVSGIVVSRLLNTLKIGLVGLALAVSVSLVLAFVSARSGGRLFERVIDLIVLFTSSTPRIVLSLFALSLTVSVSGSALAIRDGSTAALLLAAFVLAFPLFALFLGQMEGELKRAMKLPFVQYARAKGLSETAVILRHASRATLNPMLTVFGLSLGALIGGSVIVETILGWPGIGALTVAAVRNRDVPLVMGVVVIASAAVWLGNAIAEILQLLNDKRLRDAETD